MSTEEQPVIRSSRAAHDRSRLGANCPTCPTCKRKLLTQTSALCNWCGAKISDADYQERAAQTRLAADAAERARIAAIIQEEGRYGVLGRLKRRAKGASGATLSCRPLKSQRILTPLHRREVIDHDDDFDGAARARQRACSKWRLSRSKSSTPALELTESAQKQVLRVLERKNIPGAFLRIGVRGGGCSGLSYVLKPDTEFDEFDRTWILENGVRDRCGSHKSIQYPRGHNARLQRQKSFGRRISVPESQFRQILRVRQLVHAEVKTKSRSYPTMNTKRKSLL